MPDGNKRLRWAACREYGFISAGQGVKYKQAICKFDPDDIICTYESGIVFLAIGKVLDKAVRIVDLKFDGKTLHLTLRSHGK